MARHKSCIFGERPASDDISRRSRHPISAPPNTERSSRWVIINDDNMTAALPWTSSTVSSTLFSTTSSTHPTTEPLFSACCTTTNKRPYGITLDFYLFPYDSNASSVDAELDRVDHICGRHRYDIRGVKIKISTGRLAPLETDPCACSAASFSISSAATRLSTS
ncbi:hypothetical protein BD626DRAFT_579535 [Schizophyllum amplum]|uniref:Uncharacterized protein n=1 Tax=Schizophyllum amplum TaxID=97359 RepID=A0A550BRF9_9AGAR|nr:hypothetical protein BD626DRAFT_579535 [Auriculariopsis ampla]